MKINETMLVIFGAVVGIFWWLMLFAWVTDYSLLKFFTPVEVSLVVLAALLDSFIFVYIVDTETAVLPHHITSWIMAPLFVMFTPLVIVMHFSFLFIDYVESRCK